MPRYIKLVERKLGIAVWLGDHQSSMPIYCGVLCLY